MTKIFVTGATGYIGGDALHAIVSAHPEYEITALVRNSDKGAKVAAVYPRVQLVYGDLDSLDLLEEEARKADIVCNFADADHADAARALLRGLARAATPGFLIHTSGTGLLCFADRRSGSFGTAVSEVVYDDLDPRLTNGDALVPDDASHRTVEKIVLAGGRGGAEGGDREGEDEGKGGVHTAIVSPPTIVGAGRGPDGRRSMQIPRLCRCVLRRGRAFKVNQGLAKWNFVHVEDLSKLYLALVEEAAAGGATAVWNGKEDVWGPRAYYHAENGEFVWGDVAKEIAEEGKKRGWLKDGGVDELTISEIKEIGEDGAYWGMNSRSKASRARELLKWAPERGLEGEIARALEVEYETLGMKTGHATVAAGDA